MLKNLWKKYIKPLPFVFLTYLQREHPAVMHVIGPLLYGLFIWTEGLISILINTILFVARVTQRPESGGSRTGKEIYQLFFDCFRLETVSLYSRDVSFFACKLEIIEDFFIHLQYYPLWFWPVGIFLAVWDPSIVLFANEKTINVNSIGWARVKPMLNRDYLFFAFLIVVRVFPRGRPQTISDFVLLYFSIFPAMLAFFMRVVIITLPWLEHYSARMPKEYLVFFYLAYACRWGSAAGLFIFLPGKVIFFLFSFFLSL